MFRAVAGPNLFPAVGRNFTAEQLAAATAGVAHSPCRYLWDGKEYDIGVHGFLKDTTAWEASAVPVLRFTRAVFVCDGCDTLVCVCGVGVDQLMDLVTSEDDGAVAECTLDSKTLTPAMQASYPHDFTVGPPMAYVRVCCVLCGLSWCVVWRVVACCVLWGVMHIFRCVVHCVVRR